LAPSPNPAPPRILFWLRPATVWDPKPSTTPNFHHQAHNSFLSLSGLLPNSSLGCGFGCSTNLLTWPLRKHHHLDVVGMTSNRTDPISTCPFRADNVFGPVVAPPCRHGFDFTLLFEQTILSIAPSSIFLLLVPFRLFWLYRSSVTTLSHYRLYSGKAVRSLWFFLSDRGH